MKRTIEELNEWFRQHPFPKNPTPRQSAEWHQAALDFEFGPGSYVLVETDAPREG